MKKLLLTLCAILIFSTLFAQKKAFQSDALNVTGYGQVIYKFNEFDNRGLSPSTVNNSIDLARACLTASGKLGEEHKLSYTVMYDFKSNALWELWGEWKFSTAANLRFGQFKVPFTLENPMSSTRIETILGSRSISAFSNARDAGLQLAGKLFPKEDFNQLEYNIGLFNGVGVNAKDNNDYKDYVATVYWQPVQGLRIGGSAYSGKTLYGTPDNTYNASQTRFAASAEYKGSKLYGRAEYIYAKINGVEHDGEYVSLVYKLPKKWEIVAKEEYYHPDFSVDNNGIMDYTAGVNYYLDNLTRLQFNYIYTDDPIKGNNNAILTQLQVYF